MRVTTSSCKNLHTTNHILIATTMVSTRRPNTQYDSPKKNRLIGAILAGKKVAEAARMMDMPWSTASDIWKKFQETGTTHNRYRSGRPQKVDSRTEHRVVRNALEDRYKTFHDVSQELDQQISESTVQKVLAQRNYHRCVARQVPFLTHQQKKQRVQWAKQYRKFTMEDWSHVIWTDECFIELDDHRGWVFVTRNLLERHDEKCVIGTFTQSPVRVMVWGCIMNGVKGPLVVLEYPGGKGGGFDGVRYKEQVLEKVVRGFCEDMKKKRGQIFYQQDGAPAHRKGFVKQWFCDNDIPLLYHPPSSPDLNAIENVWDDLKKIIRALPRKPTTVAKLQAAVFQAWEDLPQTKIDKHVATMPERVKAILKANGGHTKY